MRALTVRQPWAWAIIHGGKNVENRTRNVAGSYRGPVAIHAGLAVDASGLEDERVLSAARAHNPDRPAVTRFNGRGWRHESSVPLGMFIGVVDLVDVVKPHLQCSFCSPWALEDHWHLDLANPRPLPEPIPARGKLGLWTPDAGSLLRLQEAVVTS